MVEYSKEPRGEIRVPNKSYTLALHRVCEPYVDINSTVNYILMRNMLREPASTVPELTNMINVNHIDIEVNPSDEMATWHIVTYTPTHPNAQAQKMTIIQGPVRAQPLRQFSYTHYRYRGLSQQFDERTYHVNCGTTTT